MPEAVPTGDEALFAGPELAARLEGALATELEGFAAAAQVLYPDSGAVARRIAGGVALFAGEGSPINQAAGLGFAGEVTPGDLDELEAFYRARHVKPLVVVSPLAHPSLMRGLSARGYAVAGFENALVRSLGGADVLPVPDASIEVRGISAEDRDRYARMVVEGFAAPGVRPSDGEWRLGRIAASRERVSLLLAYVDGQPAGTGELRVQDGLALLTGDTTVPAFRRRGVQRRLQLARLAAALEQGCDLATSDARPGGPSQRNMERLGFRVAYTRVELAPVSQ
jgi:GNAT superfamily N-acetyltransferase